jgi:hypothetical protein
MCGTVPPLPHVSAWRGGQLYHCRRSESLSYELLNFSMANIYFNVSVFLIFIHRNHQRLIAGISLLLYCKKSRMLHPCSQYQSKDVHKIRRSMNNFGQNSDSWDAKKGITVSYVMFSELRILHKYQYQSKNAQDNLTIYEKKISQQ